MPTLHWIGKDKVINHHIDVPFKVLEHAYGFDNGTQISNNDAKQFSTDHNHTLIYSKELGWQPNKLDRTEDNNAHYKNPDNDPNGLWFMGNLSSPNPRPNLTYDLISANGTIIKSPKNGWRWKKDRMDVWWDIEDTGHNRNAKYESMKIFNELKTSDVFKTPKPTKFIEKILKISTDKESIILDSYAGSATSAHAVSNLNKQDGGNRKFILIEMEDYAEDITSERVKRVINGYGSAGSPTAEGTGGSFNFYELGQPLFLEDGNLNETVGVEKIRQYVWYSETKCPYSPPLEGLGEASFLGKHNDTAYYFNYEPTEITTLDHTFLSIIKTKAEQYVIYADNCLLTKNFTTKHHIIFKKIPRDITRF